ncbi:MAG: hypothetical protein RIS21_1032 [Planctomycetota bacterium]|jgi:transcriptional regulator of arginine metabolism
MANRTDSWTDRYEAILEIVKAAPVRSQHELMELLVARGFDVTQSTLSRDLRELRVAKVGGCYVQTDTLVAPSPASTSTLADIAEYLESIREAGPNLLVVKTPPGHASAVARAVDDSGLQEVVGTVAGDDTIFIATADKPAQSRFAALLRALGEKG